MAALWGFAVVFAFMTRLLATPNTDFIFATNAAYVSPSLFSSDIVKIRILIVLTFYRFCAVLVVFVGNALPG